MGKLIDETGNTYGRLTVLYSIKKNNRTFWRCRCECGKIISVTGGHLKSGHTKSCGCYKPTNINLIDEIENKYGKLTVVERHGTNSEGKALWKCICDCGNEKITTGKSLRSGLVLSCGCLHSKGEEKIAKY